VLIDEMVKYDAWNKLLSEHLCKHWELKTYTTTAKNIILWIRMESICQDCGSIVPVLFEGEKILCDKLR
jgi:hypothetical protein